MRELGSIVTFFKCRKHKQCAITAKSIESKTSLEKFNIQVLLNSRLSFGSLFSLGNFSNLVTGLYGIILRGSKLTLGIILSCYQRCWRHINIAVSSWREAVLHDCIVQRNFESIQLKKKLWFFGTQSLSKALITFHCYPSPPLAAIG